MNGLFVSREHQRTISYRKEPLYKGTFYVMLIFVIAQFPAVGLYVYQANLAQVNGDTAQRIQKERASIVAEEQKVAPLVKSIEQASAWGKVINERKPSSSVLGRIEETIPEAVCLRKVTVTNTAGDVKMPDRIEVKISGWTRSDKTAKGGSQEGNEPSVSAFEEGLKQKFPDSVVTQKSSAIKPAQEEPAQPGINEFNLTILGK